MPIVLAKYTGSVTATKRAFQAALKDAYGAMGLKWHGSMLKRHFTQEAGSVYHYQKRMPNYMKSKAKYKGHQRPLVWSGESAAMLQAARRIKATRNGVKVTMMGPKHFYQYRIDLLQPNKTDEVTRLAPDEETVLAAMLDRIVTEKTNSEPNAAGGNVMLYQLSTADADYL